ncbi:Uncharacterized protein FKW44_023925, partial [Caligus rogercresseyi]
ETPPHSAKHLDEDKKAANASSSTTAASVSEVKKPTPRGAAGLIAKYKLQATH